jgi:hypothetical protein
LNIGLKIITLNKPKYIERKLVLYEVKRNEHRINLAELKRKAAAEKKLK